MEGENQFQFRVFTYDEMAKATESFNYKHVIGDGGFGEVFEGKIGDQTVAIKKLKFNAAKEQDERDFQNEFRALASVDHENLVKLIGYCCEGPNRLIVCEFCPNNSLRWHLNSDENPFPWSKRLELAIGSAKGIKYLHEKCQPTIIHRDIKPENIVLDEYFHAKVVDFGLAKFFPLIGNKTHISSLLKGTPVYADPEHKPNQHVSEKSDVYSFGVVLLELVSGRKPETDGVTIIDWARPLILPALVSEDMELIDPNLNNDDLDKIKIMICCAAASVYKPSRNRPEMTHIVQALEMEISPNEIWDMGADAAYLGLN